MNMEDMLRRMPDDIEKAAKMKIDISVKGRIDSILVCGMGGSGISGDIIRDYLKHESRVPVVVSKGYALPAFTNRNTLVFVVTYSGRTAETLSVLKQAMKRKAKIIAISSMA